MRRNKKKRITRKSMTSLKVGVALSMSHVTTVNSNVVNEVHKEVNIMGVGVVIEVVNMVKGVVTNMSIPRHKGQDVVIIVRVVVTEVVMAVKVIGVVRVQNLLDTNNTKINKTLDFF